jgi:hypothetical protein
MQTENGPTHRAGVELTIKGRLALAAVALSCAKKTRDLQRQKSMCLQVLRHLRAVIES